MIVASSAMKKPRRANSHRPTRPFSTSCVLQRGAWRWKYSGSASSSCSGSAPMLCTELSARSIVCTKVTTNVARRALIAGAAQLLSIFQTSIQLNEWSTLMSRVVISSECPATDQGEREGCDSKKKLGDS